MFKLRVMHARKRFWFWVLKYLSAHFKNVQQRCLTGLFPSHYAWAGHISAKSKYKMSENGDRNCSMWIIFLFTRLFIHCKTSDKVKIQRFYKVTRFEVWILHSQSQEMSFWSCGLHTRVRGLECVDPDTPSTIGPAACMQCNSSAWKTETCLYKLCKSGSSFLSL